MARHNELKKVSDLFSKYRDLLKPPQRTVERTFVDVVEDVLDFHLTPDQVRYTVSTKTITLHVPSALKQEIMTHRNELITHLKGRLGEVSGAVTII